MKIVKLIAENFKRLKAVSIEPTESMVVVSGANEQGKSSVLDAIWAAVSGAEMTRATGTIKPVRDGEDRAVVRVDLGDLIVTRKWNAAGNSSLTVENSEGAVYKSPQAILDGLVGKVAFDPLSFAQMDAKKQRDTLLGLVKIDIDLDALAKSRQAVYDRRTDVNRDYARLKAIIESTPDIPDGVPDVEISSTAIMQDIARAQEIIRSNESRRQACERLAEQVRAIGNECQKTEEQIEQIKKGLADLIAKRNTLADTHGQKTDDLRAMIKEIDAIIDPDIEALTAKISTVEATNSMVRAKNDLAKKISELNEIKKCADELTSKIDDLDTDRERALRSAQFPIDGLGFDDNGVTFNGIPFAQCSQAERLRTSIAMAMALNPKLRVLRITDGSLIDSKNMAIIEEMVNKHDFQCWIEKVDESGNVGVYIEDGEVKTVN